MKKLIIASAVVAATFSTQALADKKSEAFGACQSEVKTVLGNDTRVTLRKIRSSNGDMKVTMRVRQADGESMMLNCFYGNDSISFAGSNNERLELAALMSASKETAVN
jgi:hypothetical protein